MKLGFLFALVLPAVVALLFLLGPSSREPDPGPLRPEGAGERAEADAEEEPPPAGEAVPADLPTGVLGVVEDASGRPVPGASVSLRPLGGTEATELGGRTGADGSFRIGAPAGDVSVLARATGRGFAVRPRVTIPEDGDAVVHLILRAGGELTGSVAGPDGSPISGARIELNEDHPVRNLLARAGEGWSEGAGTLEARTGEDGRFRLGDLIPGDYDVKVRADGWVTETRPGVPVPGDTAFRLRSGGSLAGRVEIAGEALPEEILVEVLPRDQEERFPVTASPTEFRIDGIPEGDYEVRARAVGFSEDVRTVRVVAGQTAERALFVIRPGTRVRLVLRERETGRPVPDADVSLARIERSGNGWSASWEGEEGRTDASGRLELNLRPGEWFADIVAESHYGGDDLSVEVGEEAMEQEILLETSRAAIEGRVLTEDGAPVGGAFVDVSSARSNPEFEESDDVVLVSGMDAWTDAEGRFRIAKACVPQGAYGLSVTAPWGAEKEIAEVTFRPGSTVAAVTVRFPAEAEGCVVRGRIVTEEGEPAPGAVLSLAGELVAADAEGRFRLRTSSEGTLVASYSAAGYPMHLTESIPVAARSEVDLGDLVLKARGTRVVGRVADADGRGIPGANVTAWFRTANGSPQAGSTRTDPDGQFRIEGPVGLDPERVVRVQVRKQGYTPWEQDRELAPEIHVDAVLAGTASVTGTLAFAGEVPVEVRAQYLHEEFSSWWSVSMEWDPSTRRYRIPKIPPGRRTIRFRADGYAPGGAIEVDIPEGGVVEAGTTRLGLGGTVTGRVLGPDGEPIAGVQVSVKGRFVFTDTAEDGTFRLEHVPTGEQVFRVNGLPGGMSADPRVVLVKEGSAHELLLEAE